MKFIASLIGLALLLSLPSAAPADTCTVPGHPTCTITCPSDQTCQARWVSTYGGACARRCTPKPRTPPPAVTVAPPSGTGTQHVIHKHIAGVKYEDRTVSTPTTSAGEDIARKYDKSSPKLFDHCVKGSCPPKSGTGETIISPRDQASGMATGRRMHGALTSDSRRCRSQAYEKKDAEEFCRKELNCPVTCQGDSMARRWICRCT